MYLDLGFFDELHQKLGAPGDFAQAYVLAHEVGHHVQNLTGTIDSEPFSGNANERSVRVELQADCYAGVWGHDAAKPGRFAAGRVELDPGDVEEGLNAAAAIGDDRLQKMSRGPRRAGIVYPWHIGAARVVVQARHGHRRSTRLRHVREYSIIRRLRQAIHAFVDNSGLLVLGAAIALVWANIDRDTYLRLSQTLQFGVNDIGMAFFFALATKEVVEATAPGGALHSPRRAALPLTAPSAACSVPLSSLYG